MRAAEAREQLLAQHQRLRALLQQATDVRLRIERPGSELSEIMMMAGRAFIDHNRWEETVLQPILAETGQWGPARIDRMIEEHAAEHAAFVAFFAQTIEEIAEQLADFVEEVDAHMAAEERVFLNAAILRDVEP